MPSRELYKNLPLYPRWLDTQGILQHICSAIQVELDKVFDLVESQENLYNLELCPDNLLDWLGQVVGAAPIDDQWLGLGMNPKWSSAHKRFFLQQIWVYWQIKGTEIGVRQAISLWLQYESWKKSKLKIVLPFCRAPTSALPSWWGYDIPYDYHAGQEYSDRKFFGAGEYSQKWYPIWNFLDSDYSWGYDIVWNYDLRYHETLPQVGSSHLGTNSPWMHFYTEGDDWNKVFPDIHKLNPEIWNSNARTSVFGWKRNVQRCTFLLERSEFAIDKKTVVEYEFDGFQYGDIANTSPALNNIFRSPGTLWGLPSTPDTQKETITEKQIQFGYYPEFYCNGYLHLWIDEWTVPISTITERQTSIVNVPGTLCYSGLQTSVKLGGKKNVVMPGQPPIQANALLQREDTSYVLSTTSTNTAFYPIGALTEKLSAVSLTPVTIDVTLNRSLGFLSAENYRDTGYSWEQNVLIALYDGLVDDGRQWYVPQILGTPDKIIEVDNEDATSVVLCNLFALWSTFSSVYRKESIVELAEKEYSLHDLYPNLGKILQAANWKLQVSTIDGLYATVPVSSCFKNPKTSEIYFDFRKGENTLSLEFVLQKPNRTAIQAISLKLEDKLVYHENYVTPQEWVAQTILGTEFQISLV